MRKKLAGQDTTVAEGHRRQGIATALIRRVEEIAVAHGAYLVFIQAEADDDAAIGVYSKLGVRLDAAHFDIAVGQRASGAG